MTNELIFLTVALIDLVYVLISSRLGKQWLVVALVINLLLISVFGAKLIERFGYLSNTGNIFYASVFFATQLLTHLYGKEEAQKTAWIGFAAIIFFMLMAQLVVFTVGSPQTKQVNSAIEVLFAAAPRVAIASLFAYLLSQLVNINLFSSLAQKVPNLFLRVNLTNILGQAVDSIVFFSVAFYGVIPMPLLVQIMAAGYVIKVAVGFMSVLFFHLAPSPLHPAKD